MKKVKTNRLLSLGALTITTLLFTNCSFTVYNDNNDGTVSDESNSLIWAKCSQTNLNGANHYNTTTNDCTNGTKAKFTYCDITVPFIACDDGTTLTGTGQSGAFTTCDNLTLNGRLWRVPSEAELLRLAGDIRDGAAVDIFTDLKGARYWTSTPLDNTTARAIEFYAYTGGSALKTGTHHVICVSDGI